MDQLIINIYKKRVKNIIDTFWKQFKINCNNSMNVCITVN